MSKTNNNFFLSLIKGVAISLIITLVGVLIFAFIVKFAFLGDRAVKATAQFIKVLAVFLGCFFSVSERAGLIKGGLIGLISGVLIYLLFALFTGEGNFNTGFFIDLAFVFIVGALSGIISVNVKKA